MAADTDEDDEPVLDEPLLLPPPLLPQPAASSATAASAAMGTSVARRRPGVRRLGMMDMDVSSSMVMWGWSSDRRTRRQSPSDRGVAVATPG